MLRIFVTIERAEEADAPQVVALQRVVFQSEKENYLSGSIAPCSETLEELREHFERETILKALADEELVGSVSAHLERGSCYISRLTVHPGFQRHGIGTALMSAIERWFAQARRFELFIDTRRTDNLTFYEKIGYARILAVDAGGPWTRVFFEKKNPAAGASDQAEIASRFFFS